MTEFKPAASISAAARQYFQETFSRATRAAVTFPEPTDNQSWVDRNARMLAERIDYNKALLARYTPEAHEMVLNGVSVLDIRPRGWSHRDKVVIYLHGGGHVGGLARDALDSTLPLADESKLRIISVSFTLAPLAQFDQITDETVAVIRGVRKLGFGTGDIALLGDSAGGGLAAATALKYRDVYKELIAAVVLWSPWGDLTGSGDTYQTLADQEPFFTYQDHLAVAAQCYAGPDKLAHPYASPVFGDYVKGYPATLIQAGTRELLLSDSVRLYRSLCDAGQKARLDLYEGMWHVFQFKPIDTPEAETARRLTKEFLFAELGVETGVPVLVDTTALR